MPRVIAPSDRSIDHRDSAMALCCVASTKTAADTSVQPSMYRCFCFVVRTRSACGWQSDVLALLPLAAVPIWRHAGACEYPQPGVWWWVVRWSCLWVMVVSECTLHGCGEKKVLVIRYLYHSLPDCSSAALLKLCHLPGCMLKWSSLLYVLSFLFHESVQYWC